MTISKFAGRLSVDVREYYEKDGELLPGKKVSFSFLFFFFFYYEEEREEGD